MMCTYDLKYNDYNINMLQGLTSLLVTSDITDITLAVEGKLLKAHKCILSIFSSYFREIFCMNPSKDAIFFMKNVKYRIMKDLLEFMYKGKVKIPAVDFHLFVETANELKIKGLANYGGLKVPETPVDRSSSVLQSILTEQMPVCNTNQTFKQSATEIPQTSLLEAVVKQSKPMPQVLMPEASEMLAMPSTSWMPDPLAEQDDVSDNIDDMDEDKATIVEIKEEVTEVQQCEIQPNRLLNIINENSLDFDDEDAMCDLQEDSHGDIKEEGSLLVHLQVKTTGHLGTSGTDTSSNLHFPDSDTDVEDTAPDLVEEPGRNAAVDLLPRKSVLLYEKQYKYFTEWCKENHKKDYSENVLLDYFNDRLSNRKPGTLWAVYSMLKATLKINNDIDLARYHELITFLKQKNKGYQPKRSSIFSKRDFVNFLENAPDNEYLAIKVAFIIGIVGACRREELMALTIDDIQDKETVLVIRLKQTQPGLQRVFTVLNPSDNLDYISYYRRYATLRPYHCKTSRFFLKYQNHRCFAQPIGINTFGKMPSIIANYLKLPNAEGFTGHAFRRSSVPVLASIQGKLYTSRSAWKSSVREEN